MEARATRRGADKSASKSDLSDLETRILKKRKVAPSKIALSVYEPQVSTIPPPVGYLPNSPKKMKTLMSDEICRADWEISSLIKAGGSDQTKPSNEFKFRGNNNFDRLKFHYDHLNASEYVNKVKTTGWQKLTQNISSYLMRCVVLTWCLFESGDNYEKNEIKLNHEISQLKEKHKAQANKVSDLDKHLLGDKIKREK